MMQLELRYSICFRTPRLRSTQIQGKLSLQRFERRRQPLPPISRTAGSPSRPTLSAMARKFCQLFPQTPARITGATRVQIYGYVLVAIQQSAVKIGGANAAVQKVGERHNHRFFPQPRLQATHLSPSNALALLTPPGSSESVTCFVSSRRRLRRRPPDNFSICKSVHRIRCRMFCHLPCSRTIRAANKFMYGRKLDHVEGVQFTTNIFLTRDSASLVLAPMYGLRGLALNSRGFSSLSVADFELRKCPMSPRSRDGHRNDGCLSAAFPVSPMTRPRARRRHQPSNEFSSA